MSSGHFCWWLLNPWSETCFVDMESTAAWVQAVGAIAAILYTIWMYRHQIETSKLEKIEAEQEKRKSQIVAGKIFTLQAGFLVGRYLMAFSSPHFVENIRDLKPEIDDFIIWSRGLDISTYSLDEHRRILTCRSLLQNLNRNTEKHMSIIKDSEESVKFIKNKIDEELNYFDSLRV